MNNFKTGARVRIRKMPVEYVGNFNHQDSYIVEDYLGIPILYSNNGPMMLNLEHPDVMVERVNNPIEIALPTLEDKPKVLSEADRMLAFFKASAHDPNAAW